MLVFGAGFVPGHIKASFPASPRAKTIRFLRGGDTLTRFETAGLRGGTLPEADPKRVFNIPDLIQELQWGDDQTG
jgi:hypothetical protein